MNCFFDRVTVIERADDTRIAPFVSLTEAQLRSEAFCGEPIFIAESPKVINVALDAGMTPVGLLCEKRHIEGDAAEIIARCQDMPVYTGSRELLSSITGYTLTRGVLCAMRRPKLPTAAEICKNARRVAIIDGVCDTTNIGAIFRSAAALGIDGIMLTPTSCDPLNRRSIRVSMGTVFLVPWCFLEGEITENMHRYGFKTIAMALTDNSVSLDDPTLESINKIAVILGTEGDGLAKETIAKADITVKIPMSHGVDSLNVAAASAVAFWQLRVKKS